MMTMYRVLIGFAIAALLPAAATAQKVRYDFLPETDFSRFKTYALRDSGSREGQTVTETTTLYDSPLIKQRTYDAIEAQLQARGMTRDDNHPDVVVSAGRSFKTEYASYGYTPMYYPYWGWYGGYYPYGGSTYTEEITIGTLTIDLADATNGRLLWRGHSEKTVHETSKPEKRIKRVNKEVAKIFRDFPPDRITSDDDDDDDDDER